MVGQKFFFNEHTNRSKVTHEERLLPIFDTTRHSLVYHEDSWYASEDQHQKAKDEESENGNASDIRHLELRPRDNCANVHKAAEVKNHVEAAVDFIVSLLGFFEVHAIPVECVAGYEAGKEIICAEETADADREELLFIKH